MHLFFFYKQLSIIVSDKLIFSVVVNIETLAQLAEEVGIDKQKALATLQNELAFWEAVLTDISEAKEFGIKGVPFLF